MSEIEKIRDSFRPKFPERVTTLFVGESAPSGGTFFYYGNSILFNAMNEAFEGGETFLNDFRASGFYLDDLVLRPVDKLGDAEKESLRWGSVSCLADRIRDYEPSAVVTLMRGIERMALGAIHKSGLHPDPYHVPFPGNGNWNYFQREMKPIIPKLPTLNGKKWKES